MMSHTRLSNGTAMHFQHGILVSHDLSTDRNFSTNLARGLDILRAFTADEPSLSNRELSDRTGLPKPTVSRLTYTLTLLGYLSRVEDIQKYRLAAGVLSLGHPLLASMRVRQIAGPHMERIARETGCTVNLGMRDGLKVVYVDSCRADAGNVYQPDIGATRSLLTSAIGRALLLARPPDERKAILNRLKVMDPESFAREKVYWEKELARFPHTGYCLSQGDWKKEVHAVAVPVRQPAREELVAMNCTMSSFRLKKVTLERDVAPRLLEAVRQIETACGVEA
jgi:DNA-binding IclR family transcriptional regulator